MVVHLSHRHRLLLTAVIGDGPQASAAWAQWRTRLSINAADGEEASVLPLLASRLHVLDAPGDSQRLRGVRRHAVVRQFAIREEMTAAAAALQSAGIQPVTIKGLALAAAYGSGHTRGIGDADVLVPPGTADAAVDALTAAGFRLGMGLRRGDLGVWAARCHAVALRRPNAQEVDLHWRLSHQPRETEPLITPIILRAETTDEGWSIPNPAHQIAIAVAHGWPAISSAALRMLVDIAMLLAQPGITAELVDEVAGPHRLRGALDSALTTLSSLGVEGAATLRDELPPARSADRRMSVLLRTNRDGLGTRVATALAYRNPRMLRAETSTTVDTSAPPDPATDAIVSVCGVGWWLADGWATWARRRVARLDIGPADPDLLARLHTEREDAHALVISVGAPPTRTARRRWAVVCSPSPRLLRLDPTASRTVAVRLHPNRTTTIRLISPRLRVAQDLLGNGDRRRVGSAITALVVVPARWAFPASSDTSTAP